MNVEPHITESNNNLSVMRLAEMFTNHDRWLRYAGHYTVAASIVFNVLFSAHIMLPSGSVSGHLFKYLSIAYCQ